MPAPPTLGRRLAPLGAGVMALAIGIAVGAGPLSDVGTGSEQLAARTGGAPGPADDAGARQLQAADALARASAGALYDGALDGRAVALVSMPGADPAVVEAMRDQAADAGARVTASWRIGDEMLSAGAATLVDSLGRRLVRQQPDLPVDEDTPAYERAGALLGMVVASQRPEGQEPVPATTTVADTLRAGGLLEGPEDARLRAPLVVVVMPADSAEPTTGADDETVPGADAVATDAVTAGLLRGLAARSVGTVVVADTESGADGALHRLREQETDGDDPAYATVDGVERPVGQVLAGLALLQADQGVLGDWGTGGDDGFVPRPAS